MSKPKEAEIFYRTLTHCAAVENNEQRYSYLPGEVLTKFKVGQRVRVTVKLADEKPE